MLDFLKDIFPIVGSAIGTASAQQAAMERQHDAQNFAAGQAIDSRNFNAAEAQKQREWTEYMDRSATRRRVADLKDAGLNPMLAYGNLHIGSAGGSSATSSPASSGGSGEGSSPNIPAAMQTASQIDVNEAVAARTRAEVERVEAETDEVRERTKNYDPQRREIEARIPTHPALVSKYLQDIAESSVRIERIWEEAKHYGASAAELTQRTENLRATIPQIRAQIDQLKALTAKDSALTAEIKQRISANLPDLERTLMTLEAQDRRMAQPGHEATSAAQQSFIGQLGAYLRQLGGLPAIITNRRSTNIGTINNRGQRP